MRRLLEGGIYLRPALVGGNTVWEFLILDYQRMDLWRDVNESYLHSCENKFSSFSSVFTIDVYS